MSQRWWLQLLISTLLVWLLPTYVLILIVYLSINQVKYLCDLIDNTPLDFELAIELQKIIQSKIDFFLKNYRIQNDWPNHSNTRSYVQQ